MQPAMLQRSMAIGHSSWQMSKIAGILEAEGADARKTRTGVAVFSLKHLSTRPLLIL
ncbi:UNVERIFIED_ORG: hypothetical protein GGE63_002988 [Rhizobium esperanzae]